MLLVAVASKELASLIINCASSKLCTAGFFASRKLLNKLLPGSLQGSLLQRLIGYKGSAAIFGLHFLPDGIQRRKFWPAFTGAFGAGSPLLFVGGVSTTGVLVNRCCFAHGCCSAWALVLN